MPHLRLSALDLSPIPSGTSAGGALRNSIDLAVHCEALGLSRYWLAEHHNAGGLASSAPEIMIGQVAAATRRIRVGAGGIMLPNHSPLKVAELFRVLHALFPGRIDLALGRAAGTDPRTARALRRSQEKPTSDAFESELDALLAYFAPRTEPRRPFDGSVAAIPLDVPPPAMFLLGSSAFGPELAAKRGFGCAFAHHMNPDDAPALLRGYRAAFAATHDAPYAIVSVNVVCAETDARARELARSGELSGLQFARGLRDLPMPSVDDARSYPYDAEDDALLAASRARKIVGDPAHVAAALQALAQATQADEVMLLTHVHDHAARRASYTLVAEALGVTCEGP